MLVDALVAAIVVAAALWGMLLGLARALPLAGFALGAVIGSRLPPLLGEDLDGDFALVAALPAALLAGALLAALGERLGWRVARRLRERRRVSVAGGAMVGAIAGLVMAWFAAPIVAEVPSTRQRLADSAILERLNGVLEPAGPRPAPEPPPLTAELPIYDVRSPSIALGDSELPFDPDVVRAQRSVVQVLARSCDGGGSGSGWVARPGVVVTNAHVVAASTRLLVRVREKSRQMPAVPIWFDGDNDLALLRVIRLRGARPLAIVEAPRRGTAAALLGFPLGRWAARRARIGPTTDRLVGRLGGRDLPGVSAEITGRLVTTIRAKARPGNSGGPVVDDRGRVLTTVFGGTVFAGAALGVPNRYVRRALSRAGPRVSTGRCEPRGRRR